MSTADAQLLSNSMFLKAFEVEYGNQQSAMIEEREYYDKKNQEMTNRRKMIKQRKNFINLMTGGVQKEKFNDDLHTIDEHRIDLNDLVIRLDTNLKTGLTKIQAEDKLQKNGRNILQQKKRVPWQFQLLKEFTGFFGMLLIIGGSLCFLVYGLSYSDLTMLYLGVMLFLINSMNGGNSFYQSVKSEEIINGFNDPQQEIQVIRDGTQLQLQSSELVQGDIIMIECGKKIPADIRIIESQDMFADNTSINGYNYRLKKQTNYTDMNIFGTQNILFSGSLCKEGSGKGIVIFTGDRSIAARIAKGSRSINNGPSHLRIELGRFIKIMTFIAMFLGILFFILGFVLGYKGTTNVIFAVGIIVGFVPQTLLVTVSVALTHAVQKMAGRQVLVKNLEIVEALGSTTCILIDQAAIQQNRLTVEHLWYNDHKVLGANRQKMGEKYAQRYDYTEGVFNALHECAILSSEAIFDNSLPQEQMMKIQNNITYTQDQKQKKNGRSIERMGYKS